MEIIVHIAPSLNISLLGSFGHGVAWKEKLNDVKSLAFSKNNKFSKLLQAYDLSNQDLEQKQLILSGVEENQRLLMEIHKLFICRVTWINTAVDDDSNFTFISIFLLLLRSFIKCKKHHAIM